MAASASSHSTAKSFDLKNAIDEVNRTYVDLLKAHEEKFASIESERERLKAASMQSAMDALLAAFDFSKPLKNVIVPKIQTLGPDDYKRMLKPLEQFEEKHAGRLALANKVKLPHDIATIPAKDMCFFTIDGFNPQRDNSFWYDLPYKDGYYEPGYKYGMEKAFFLMQLTIEQPLTVELIVAFHDMAMSTVKCATTITRTETGLRDRDVEFGLGSNTTYEGLSEAIARYSHLCAFSVYKQNQTPNVDPNACLTEGEHYRVDPFPRDVKANKMRIEGALSTLIQDYQKKIKAAKDDIDKLWAIAEFVHQSELLHPFIDGNTRTNIFLVANKLLIQNGFPPAMFEDPNRFSLYSVAQSALEMMKGILKTCHHYQLKKDYAPLNAAIQQRVATEKALLAIERRNRTLKRKITPTYVIQQQVIIQEALEGKKTHERALRQVERLEKEESHQMKLFMGVKAAAENTEQPKDMKQRLTY